MNEIYDGVKTQKVKDRFTNTIKKSINEFLNDIVRTKLEGALEVNKAVEKEIESPQEIVEEVIDVENGPITTDEELQGFSVAKALLYGNIELDRITYKDTLNYFSITIDDKVTKWICRLYFNGPTKFIRFPELDEEGNKTDRGPKIAINSINDLYNFKDKLIESVKMYD